MDSPATPPGSTSQTVNRPSAALTVYRPLVEKVLAALGALVTHHFAYLLSSLIGAGGVDSEHGHLSVQWAVVTPLAVVAVAAFAMWQLRGLGFRSSLSVRTLSVFIIGFFLIQETVEGLVDGRSPVSVAAHPAIIIGVALAPILAWVISRFMAGVTEFVARLLQEPPFGGPGPKKVLIPIPVRATSSDVRAHARPRAPPSRLRN